MAPMRQAVRGVAVIGGALMLLAAPSGGCKRSEPAGKRSVPVPVAARKTPRPVGRAHANGLGVPKDDAQAVTLYRRACTGGDGAGCTGLGHLYQDGKGVARDLEAAIANYN